MKFWQELNFYNFDNLVCACHYNGCIMNEWCHFPTVHNEIVGRNAGLYMHIPSYDSLKVDEYFMQEKKQFF